VTVLERGAAVGGLARTVSHGEFRFDLGGHRFLADNAEVTAFVRNLLGPECLAVPRSSKILMEGRLFDYPLKPVNAVFGFGLTKTARILRDYLGERLRRRVLPRRSIVSLEDWVVENFGRTLFDLYFRDYSEKVWGLSCEHIDKRWVKQRIQGLSLGKAIMRALRDPTGRREATLADEFLYPRRGIGCIAEQLAGSLTGRLRLQTTVTEIHHEQNKISTVLTKDATGLSAVEATHHISTLPLQALVAALRPRPPASVLMAASQLRSRDLVLVAVMADAERLTDQTWVYFPDKDIPFGRIHEPKNWNADMAPAAQTCVVAEYFCFRGDRTWNASDADLANQTVAHLQQTGIMRGAQASDYKVIRVPDAYPLFEVGYHEHCELIYQYLERFDNLTLAGRGGMFRYYNMDTAIASGMDAAKTALQYHRQDDAGAGPSATALGGTS